MLIFQIGAVADAFGVHRNTVRNWIKKGLLAAQPTVGKKYIIDAEEFRRFFAAQGVDESELDRFFQSVSGTAEPETPATAKAQRTSAKERPAALPKTNHLTLPAKSNGSVLIAGGGIAGIQSALDLANSGYFVHLIEKSPGIGGAMAMLDKTFPTNDCAM